MKNIEISEVLNLRYYVPDDRHQVARETQATASPADASRVGAKCYVPDDRQQVACETQATASPADASRVGAIFGRPARLLEPGHSSHSLLAKNNP